MNISAMPSQVVSLGRPRPSRSNPGTDTSGNLPNPSPGGAAISGAIQGLISGSRIGGVSGAVAGAVAGTVGGMLGVQTGMRTHSFQQGLAVGSLTGAVAAAGMSAGLAALFQTPISLPVTAGMAVLGGLTGAVGTLSGSKRAETRDSVYGGYLAGLAAAEYTHNPFLSIASAAGAGAAGRAVTAQGRAALGVVTGAAAGALAGLPFLIAGMPSAGAMIATSAIAGAIVGPLGAVAGPVARQATRNLTDSTSAAISDRLDPFIAKHPLGTVGKMGLGATIGTLTVGPLGMLGPALGLPLGLSVAATLGVGATVGAANVYKVVKKNEAFQQMQAAAKTYAGAYPALKGAFAPA